MGIRDFCAEERALFEGNSAIRTFTQNALCQRLFAGESWGHVVHDIIAVLPEQVYISFDIDGLDPALCPGTGTPVPGGLSFEQASYLVHEVARARTVIGCDLTEVGASEWDGNVGARILYKLLGSIALRQ